MIYRPPNFPSRGLRYDSAHHLAQDLVWMWLPEFGATGSQPSVMWDRVSESQLAWSGAPWATATPYGNGWSGFNAAAGPTPPSILQGLKTPAGGTVNPITASLLLYCKTTPTTNRTYLLIQKGSTDGFRLTTKATTFEFQLTSANAASGGSTSVNTTTIPSAGNLYFVTATIGPIAGTPTSANLRLYVNGKLDGTPGTTTRPPGDQVYDEFRVGVTSTTADRDLITMGVWIHNREMAAGEIEVFSAHQLAMYDRGRRYR